MSSVALLLGLLVVAYAGSHLLGGKGGGLRLASGAEYLLLGLALGPHALGVVDRSTLIGFQPIALVGTAWLALVIGADYGYQGERRVTLRGFIAGILLSSLSFAAIFAALFFAGRRFGLLGGQDLWLIPAGVGLVACETTRHAVQWVLGRTAADGPLSRLVGDVADCDDLVPILGLTYLCALEGQHGVAAGFPAWSLTLTTLGMGALLGITAAALLRAEQSASDGWGVLIGATLVAAGTAFRLGLATLAGTFLLGLTLSVVSRHSAELRAMLHRTEQAVMSPLMMLAGALVVFDHPWVLAGCLVAATLVRGALRLLAAPLLTWLSGAPRAAAPALALGLMPSSVLSVIVAMTFDSRFGGKAGSVVLGVSVGLALVGELVGPANLRRALVLSGEIQLEPAPPEAGSGAVPGEAT